MKLIEIFSQFIKKRSHALYPDTGLKTTRYGVFVLIALLFVLPIALASYFYTHDTFKGAAHKNHGTLVQPPINVSDIFLKNLHPHAQSIKPQWTLIYLQQTSCGRQCEKHLYSLRQIHIALGKDHARLQRVFYATQPLSKLQQKKLLGMGFRITQGTHANLDQLAMRLKYSFGDGTVILIDPRGYFVLFYPKNFKPKDILSDLRHLLKFSQIG